MTVPVVSSTRKSPWRFLPEIHASRFSISGSLRPKIGLLILSVLLVLSIVLLIVPFVRKQQSDLQGETNSKVSRNHLINNFLRSARQRSRSNHAFSAFGLSALGSLVVSLSRTTKLSQTTYSPLAAINSRASSSSPHHVHNFETFHTNITVYKHPDTILPQNFQLSASTVGAKVEQLASVPPNQIAILNSNKLSLPIRNYSLSEEYFHLGPKKLQRVRMIGFKAEIRTLKLREAELFQVQLAGDCVLQIVLPYQLNNLAAVIENLDLMHQINESAFVDQSRFLKFPVLAIEDTYETKFILEAFGLIPADLPQLPNITHQTTIDHLLDPGAPAVAAEEGTMEELVCDHAFLFNIFTPSHSLPLITGIYSHPM